jgi:hypothetical protein
MLATQGSSAATTTTGAHRWVCSATRVATSTASGPVSVSSAASRSSLRHGGSAGAGGSPVPASPGSSSEASSPLAPAAGSSTEGSGPTPEVQLPNSAIATARGRGGGSGCPPSRFHGFQLRGPYRRQPLEAPRCCSPFRRFWTRSPPPVAARCSLRLAVSLAPGGDAEHDREVEQPGRRHRDGEGDRGGSRAARTLHLGMHSGGLFPPIVGPSPAAGSLDGLGS